MGWNNPPLPWRTFERTLSGRPKSAQELAEERTAASRAEAAADTAAADTATATTTTTTTPTVPYAELHAHSAYSFLDGANEPRELVTEAARLGLSGLAITDHDGFYGSVRFAEEAAAHPGLLTVYGAELSLGLDGPQQGIADPGGQHLLVLAQGTSGYHRLATAITEAQLAGGEKGRPVYELEQLAAQANGEWAILTGCRKGSVRHALAHQGMTAARSELDRLTALFGTDNVFVELTDHGHPGDDVRNDQLAELAAAARLPTLATNAVHYARRSGQPLAEAVAAVRARRSLDELDPYLPASGSAHLRSGAAMTRRFARYPGAVARTVPLASDLAFPLRAARPRLPKPPVPEGHTLMSWLRELVAQGVARRYPRATEATHARIQRELQVIEQKDFPGYFLIVHDIVQQARSLGILCQGRGSAANSAVCFVLGITSVDSIFYDLPFERFLSSMREEEPDIDVDFDSGRREEIIQYVYATYGRRNAAQVANVITYRPKAAVRDAAKALGYSAGQQTAWTRGLERWGTIEASPESPIPSAVTALAEQLLGAPRHLGIHSGGMVLTDRPVGEVCPIEHARMENRTVLQWDKDDCAWMGLVKFDLLGLGMLSALQFTFDLIAGSTGEHWDFESIPKEEPGVYDMLCRADSIGVFQVESRAQMNTLPRLLPRTFTDLVIEIALIRPGPVQGGAVHPYLRRRAGEEDVTYAHPALEPVLKRTLGIPIFQEQLMQMAMAVGGCSAEDADLLRRAMGSKRGQERISELKEKLLQGMATNGIDPATAEQLYGTIEAFASFGFAESHSISFALLVYLSSWCKLHYPAAFLAGLLRAQPMGFYSGRTLTDDARRHGVHVLRPDVQRSGVHAALERHGAPAGTPDAPADPTAPPTGRHSCTSFEQDPVGAFDRAAPDTTAEHRRDGNFVVRLGLAEIRGIDAAVAERIVTARQRGGPFLDLADLARRADLDRSRIEMLASADACSGLGLGRREALWSAAPAADNRERYLPGTSVSVQPPLLPVLSPAEQTEIDLWSTGIAPGAHPMSFLRRSLDQRGVLRSDRLPHAEAGRRVEVAGLVTHRQRPGTAGGITFLSLEDESGMVNVIASVGVWTRHRVVARTSPALVVRGRLERSPQGIVNVVAEYFEALTAPGKSRSRDFQ